MIICHPGIIELQYFHRFIASGMHIVNHSVVSTLLFGALRKLLHFAYQC